jgi:hypothetical protein
VLPDDEAVGDDDGEEDNDEEIPGEGEVHGGNGTPESVEGQLCVGWRNTGVLESGILEY